MVEGVKSSGGWWVFLCFVAFFGVIVAVNTVFITMALSTHSGVVTERPYEKGLAYDRVLEAARAQPHINEEPSYEDGVLRWVLKDEQGQPIRANVQAHLVRPVKDGYDFDVALKHQGNGVHEVSIDLPLQGRWQAQLRAQWQGLEYHKTYAFTAR